MDRIILLTRQIGVFGLSVRKALSQQLLELADPPPCRCWTNRSELLSGRTEPCTLLIGSINGFAKWVRRYRDLQTRRCLFRRRMGAKFIFLTTADGICERSMRSRAPFDTCSLMILKVTS